jgi:hypothetical protein
MQPVIDVTMGAAGPPHEVVLKLQGGDDWELNVWATFEDLAKLRGVRAAPWDQRRSIVAGTSAGGKVFRCAPGDGSDPEIATVLIGHDAVVQTPMVSDGTGPVDMVERWM